MASSMVGSSLLSIVCGGTNTSAVSFHSNGHASPNMLSFPLVFTPRFNNWGFPYPSFSYPLQHLQARERPFVTPLKNKRKKRVEVIPKIHVKVGDMVKVISGSNRNKVGCIIRTLRWKSEVIVKGVNMKARKLKGSDGKPGRLVRMASPIHSSNVMLYSEKYKVASRIGYTIDTSGNKVRYLKRTGEIIDSVEKWKRVIRYRHVKGERKQEGEDATACTDVEEEEVGAAVAAEPPLSHSL